MKSIVIAVPNNGMSSAEYELRQKLLSNFFNIAIKDSYLPHFMCFYGEGVKLLTKDSIIINELKEIENKGVKIISCKTCLGFYNLLDEIQVGSVGTMHDILDIMWKADKVLYL